MDSVKSCAVRLRQETQKIIVGKEHQIDLILMAIFSGGHVLLSDLPGSKTLHAERRSVVHITHASLQAGDGFSLSACHRFAELDHPVRFAVYPRLMQADVRWLTRQLPIPLPNKAAGRKA